MTKQELSDFFDERFMANTADAAFRFSQGKFEVSNPDKPTTELEMRLYNFALTTTLLDTFAHLGLVGK